jgi:hypothetical protein
MRFHAQTGKIRAIHFANLSQPTVQNREGVTFAVALHQPLKRLAGLCIPTAKCPLLPGPPGFGPEKKNANGAIPVHD